MARILRNNHRPGSKVSHDLLNTLANFWNDLQVQTGPSTALQRQADGHNTIIQIGTGTASSASLPLVHVFAKTSDTGGDWTAGKVYFAGSDLTLSPAEPSTITVDASNTKYWVKVDFAAGSAGWYSGTEFPEMDDSTEIYRMLEVEFTDGAIVSFVCPTAADIHVTAKSS